MRISISPWRLASLRVSGWLRLESAFPLQHPSHSRLLGAHSECAASARPCPTPVLSQIGPEGAAASRRHQSLQRLYVGRNQPWLSPVQGMPQQPSPERLHANGREPNRNLRLYSYPSLPTMAKPKCLPPTAKRRPQAHRLLRCYLRLAIQHILCDTHTHTHTHSSA